MPHWTTTKHGVLRYRRQEPCVVERFPMPDGPHAYELNAREQQILRLVVESFVSTAGPVGSRF